MSAPMDGEWNNIPNHHRPGSTSHRGPDGSRQPPSAGKGLRRGSIRGRSAMRILGVVATLFSLLVPMSSPVWGQQLTFTDLGWGMAAYGINDAGQIVGLELGEISCDGPSVWR